MANLRQRYDEAADNLGIDTDQRASLLVLHEGLYPQWPETGKGLEISRRRMVEITEVLILLAVIYPPDRARTFLYSPNQLLRARIPAAVLRVGKVDDVRDLIETMGGFT